MLNRFYTFDIILNIIYKKNFSDLACLNIGEGKCRYPVKCNCNKPFGGFDCSQVPQIPSLHLGQPCCDLRHENCNNLNIYGYPFSKADQIYAKFELIETTNNTAKVIYSNKTDALIISQNNVQTNINHLEMFTLFKNIHNSNKVFDDSTATVNIYLSYVKNKFSESAKTVLKLFDSKCTDCNGVTKPVSILLILL